MAESRRDEEAEGGDGVKESSDVQSTASLVSRREKKLSGTSSGEVNQSGGGGCKGTNGNGTSEPQTLADFLDLVRARSIGSVFAGRLESQETPRYKSLIKEHIDLGIIQKRVEVGQYTDCHTKFYRDLMLLISNAILFFSKRSSEHKAAVELRQLVAKHFGSHLCVKKTQASNSIPPLAPPKSAKPEVVDHTDLKPKLAKTGPLIACRKRSSILGKLLLTEAGEKESSLVTPPGSVKSGEREVSKQEGEKSSPTLFNVVTKKRSRDHNFAARSSSSKNNNGGNRSSRPTSSPTKKPSSKTPVSSRGATADTRKPSPGNSSTKMRQGSRPNKDLLLDALSNAEKRKICNNANSGGNAESDRRKESASKEKAKSEEGRESPGSQNLGRLPKRAAVGKRSRDATGETDKSKKRQRR